MIIWSFIRTSFIVNSKIDASPFIVHRWFSFFLFLLIQNIVVVFLFLKFNKNLNFLLLFLFNLLQFYGYNSKNFSNFFIWNQTIFFFWGKKIKINCIPFHFWALEVPSTFRYLLYWTVMVRMYLWFLWMNHF